MRVVIVGGVAGGMSAATRLRRLNEDIEIVVLEKGLYISFANCGLPYHISGEIEDREDLLLNSPESVYNRFQIEAKVNHEVIAIDPQANEVTFVHDGAEGKMTYDHLILSMGADPIVPNIEGYDHATNVFTLRNVPDLDKIMAHIEAEAPKKAVVIGAGYIGLEVAESLKNRGLDVTIVEMAPYLLPPFDEEMATFIQDEVKRNGINFITSQSATEFRENGQQVVLANGEILESDITILSVGVRPRTEIAAQAGIELGDRGGIIVDKKYRTNFENIYAVGDAILVEHQITGKPASIALASPANRQGRQVADIISGRKVENRGGIGTAIVRVFDLAAGSTGLNERLLNQAGLQFKSVHIRSNNHAGYFPGATPLIGKLIFNPETGEIYGAQAIGQDGVDKRIDVIATAIKAGLTIYDLPELELTYAPPFGSAKDPVNMLGYVAMNISEGISENIQWYELDDAIASGKKFLDVRDEAELTNNGRFDIEDQINIPLNQLRDRMDELDIDIEYIVSCASGQRSYNAERILKQHGFKVTNLDGAFNLFNNVRPERIIK